MPGAPSRASDAAIAAPVTITPSTFVSNVTAPRARPPPAGGSKCSTWLSTHRPESSAAAVNCAVSATTAGIAMSTGSGDARNTSRRSPIAHRLSALSNAPSASDTGCPCRRAAPCSAITPAATPRAKSGTIVPAPAAGAGPRPPATRICSPEKPSKQNVVRATRPPPPPPPSPPPSPPLASSEPVPVTTAALIHRLPPAPPPGSKPAPPDTAVCPRALTVPSTRSVPATSSRSAPPPAPPALTSFAPPLPNVTGCGAKPYVGPLGFCARPPPPRPAWLPPDASVAGTPAPGPSPAL